MNNKDYLVGQLTTLLHTSDTLYPLYCTNIPLSNENYPIFCFCGVGVISRVQIIPFSLP